MPELARPCLPVINFFAWPRMSIALLTVLTVNTAYFALR